MADPTFAFVGTGANGASIGADLIRAGLDVVFIEQWPSHVEAMRERGLTVHLPDRTEVTPVEAYHFCQVAELRTTFDVVFISVKTYDTRWVAELIRPLLGPESVVVGLQNGMTVDDVAEICGAERSVGAVLGIAANMFEPGVVVRQYDKTETWITVGALDGHPSAGVALAAEALGHASVASVTDDIRAAKWMKLIANVPEMLPSAILSVPLLTAVGFDGMRPVMDAASREAYAVAIALGVHMVPIFGLTEAEVPPDDSYSLLLLDQVLQFYSRPDTRVAVLQDWMKGRRAELDAFSGYIVRKGHEVGVPVPVNEGILAVAERIERGELRPDVENVAELASLLEPAA
ncbi:ketopantoate reductase family protein [Herbiconiux daphne]|uniref:2-dehydropantoate 2-reductase n=1 Tax=Herbiconiux daphne TaxID=2970914 RepID=A0ABT2H5F7_9MICO|nr:2-dehydropantoate 2-reductase [Herbiconiux daphne]MCS5735174.1 2-dehydropantoate 2-reductase [Herbiconiux daphne]